MDAVSAAAWMALIVGAVVAAVGLLQLPETVKRWHGPSGTLSKRVLICSVVVIVVGALMYFLRRADQEREKTLQESIGRTLREALRSNEPTASPTNTAATQTSAPTTSGTVSRTSTIISAPTPTAVSSDTAGVVNNSLSTAPPDQRDDGQSAWERLNHGLILAAKRRPPDFEEIVGPDEVSSAIDVHSHALRVWVFDVTRSAEAFWFWGYTERDMVVAPCKDKQGWQSCTPRTTFENPPKSVRIHNRDRTNSMAIKIWFVPYADNGQPLTTE